MVKLFLGTALWYDLHADHTVTEEALGGMVICKAQAPDLPFKFPFQSNRPGRKAIAVLFADYIPAIPLALYLKSGLYSAKDTMSKNVKPSIFIRLQKQRLLERPLMLSFSLSSMQIPAAEAALRCLPLLIAYSHLLCRGQAVQLGSFLLQNTFMAAEIDCLAS